MKFFKIKLLIASFLSLGLLFSSCQKEQNGVVPSIIDKLSTADNQKIMNALCNHSHDNCGNIEISDSGIIVDGDSSLDKDGFLEYLNMLDNGYEEEPAIAVVPDPNNPDELIEIPMTNIQYFDENNQPIIERRQRLYSVLGHVKNSEVSTIKYHIRPSITQSCDSGWAASINAAINYWNNIEGSKVKFTASTQSAADLIIACDTDAFFTNPDFRNLKDPVAGIATSPMYPSRTVGRHISFRDDVSGDIQMGIAIHEIGHTLGFRHTDQNSGYHMYDTPITDANSILNSLLTDPNRRMSVEDKKAVRRLWPDRLEKPSNVTFQKAGGSVRIKFKNQDPTTRPYNHVNVAHKHNGVFKWAAWGHQPDANGNYDILWIKSFAPGKHEFFVMGASHGNEVLSCANGWYTVHM